MLGIVQNGAELGLAGADRTACPKTPEKQLATLKQECSQEVAEAAPWQPGNHRVLMKCWVFSACLGRHQVLVDFCPSSASLCMDKLWHRNGNSGKISSLRSGCALCF